MLGLDTNVLVRFLVRDDEGQFEKAAGLIGSESEVFVSLLVVMETEWVLRSRYGYMKEEILGAISGLLEAMEVRFEDESAVEEALFFWKEGAADFADCLIGARNRRAGCLATATFDAKAARQPGYTAL